MNTSLNTMASYVQVDLQLVSGQHHQFAQNEACLAQQVLGHLRPDRVYTQKSMIFHDAKGVTIQPTEGVERMDLFSDALPQWPHVERIVAIEEIDVEEFQCLAQRDPLPTLRILGRTVPTLPTEFGAAVELRSGAVVYFRILTEKVEVSARERSEITADDTRQFLTHFFTRPIVFGWTRDRRGIFLLNPANIVRYALSPAPQESVAGAWPMVETH